MALFIQQTIMMKAHLPGRRLSGFSPLLKFFAGFSHQLTRVVFHWSGNDSNYLQISRTLLSILGDLNNAVVCGVSILSLIFQFFQFFCKPSETIPSATTTTSIRVTLMFHCFCCCFFSSLARSKYLSIFSFPFIFNLWSTRKTKNPLDNKFFFSSQYRGQ